MKFVSRSVKLTAVETLEHPETREPDSADNFTRLFHGVIADTPALMRESYALRYQVYCVENTFENPTEHSLGLETDSYDSRSMLGLLTHSPTGVNVGAVRAIFKDADTDWRQAFPIQALCNHPLLQSREVIESSAEASRLCVSRKRRSHICHPSTYYIKSKELLPDGRRIYKQTCQSLPYMSLGVLHLLMRITVKRRLRYLFSLLDPRLVRSLHQHSIYIMPLGADVEHHGMRTPAYLTPRDVCESLFRHNRTIWKILSNNGELHEEVLANRL